MPNIELLEKSMPVAPIRIAALGCRELAEEVDRKLVKFRNELVERKQLSVIPQGYSEESFIDFFFYNCYDIKDSGFWAQVYFARNYCHMISGVNVRKLLCLHSK